jgi:16S rRNA (adenine1518-N6/adenine1519-N6)-dimethyltransferase
MHARIAERITLTASLDRPATVLEVGPGRGILTRELLKRAKKVIAIEADETLFGFLLQEFKNEIGEGKLEVLHADIRAFDLERLPRGYHVVANIPYYITGELIRDLLTVSNQPASMTLLVQKEVAERIARAKKESILSLSVKAYGTPSYEFTVKRGAFNPPPSVDSAVLQIRDISRQTFPSRDLEKRFFELLHAGFGHKRKYVRRNLEKLVSLGALEEAKIGEKDRAEALTLSQWVSLCKSSG